MSLVVFLLLLFVCIPIVCHYFTHDVPHGACASGLVFGLICGAIAGWNSKSVELFPFAFFLAAFVELGPGVVVGLIYRALGSSKRREYADRAALRPVSPRREIVGAIGGISIALGVAIVALLYYLDTGIEPSMPLKPFLAFVAFFLLGVFTLVRLFRKRNEK